MKIEAIICECVLPDEPINAGVSMAALLTVEKIVSSNYCHNGLVGISPNRIQITTKKFDELFGGNIDIYESSNRSDEYIRRGIKLGEVEFMCLESR